MKIDRHFLDFFNYDIFGQVRIQRCMNILLFQVCCNFEIDHMSTGVNMGRQGTLAYWLLHMLVFVTGNLGRQGGNFFSLGFYERSPSAGRSAPQGFLDTPFGPVRKPGGIGINLPGNLLASYITDPDEPIRALFVSSGNSS